MENQLIIGVWILAIFISFVPMPVMYKIAAIVASIILIALATYIAKRNNRLSTMNLVINLIIIGWDMAVVFMALAR